MLELDAAVEQSFGKGDPYMLVWNADSSGMNATILQRIIERASESDPILEASGHGQDVRAVFRRPVPGTLSLARDSHVGPFSVLRHCPKRVGPMLLDALANMNQRARH